MKYLVAVALIAVASAMPEPLRLPQAPFTAPISGPESLLERVQVSQPDIAPLMRLPEPLRLPEPQAPFIAPISGPESLLEPVQLSQPDIAPLMVPQELMDEVALLVKFVDTPETVDAAVDTSDYSINIVEEAINADTPVQIKLMDTPLPESVVLPLGQFVIFVADIVEPLETNDADFAVKVVDVADVEGQTFSRPMARAAITPSVEAVKIDSALETSDADFTVQVVDVADVDEETPSYIPIKSDVESPQNINDADFAVKIVDLADVDEESPPYVIKQAALPESIVQPFEAVKVAESPMAISNADFTVKIVDVAEETATFTKQYLDPRLR